MMTLAKNEPPKFSAAANASTDVLLSALHPSLKTIELESPLIHIKDIVLKDKQAFPLNIEIMPGDRLSKILTITIKGLPNGASLSAGVDNGNGIWNLTPIELTGLKLQPQPEDAIDFDLSIEAVATSPTGILSSSEDMLSINMAGATADTIQKLENKGILLNIDDEILYPGGPKKLDIVISGIPTGAKLSTGTNNGDGTWNLTSKELKGLKFFPPLAHTTYKLGVTAVFSGSSEVFLSLVLVVDRIGFVTFSTLGTDQLYGHQNCFDLIDENDGRDFIYAYDNTDDFYNDNKDSRLSVNDDSDIGFGCRDRNIMFGESGNDFLGGHASIDFIDGGIGDDVISVGVDTDYLIDQVTKEQFFNHAW